MNLRNLYSIKLIRPALLIIIVCIALNPFLFNSIAVFAADNVGGISYGAAKTPMNLISVLIWWAFRLAGILAFAMIIFAGFQYLTSGGNTAQQKDAQERIMNAIIGLVLLFAFYIILHTINPNILNTSL